MGALEIRTVEDEAGTQVSLEISNAVYWTMPASAADQQNDLEHCTDYLEGVAYLDRRPGRAPDRGGPRSDRGRASPARQGVARALKATQIVWAKRAGYERLETGNEVRNAPIRRLNEQLGYREIPGRALLRGPLAPLSAAAP